LHDTAPLAVEGLIVLTSALFLTTPPGGDFLGAPLVAPEDLTAGDQIV
jgi:hypothetical protein